MRRLTTVSVIAVVAVLLPGLAYGPAYSQAGSRYFPETQQTVSGRFLEYWQANGGLAQQGYPISAEFTEVSETNGKPYTVQYFERAVFELHPENKPPHDVLLSLLGSFLYKRKYPGGAPDQVASTDNPRLFAETGKTIGGKFRAYWEANGGLAQQGYPVSDEFQEVSELNGQTYTVQYFERAVFELHPENAGTPYEVLLSQLGKFRYREKHSEAAPAATAPAPTEIPPAAAPTATAAPAGLPSAADCDKLPENQGIDIEPRCGPLYTNFKLVGNGFTDDALVGVWATTPDGELFGAPFHVPVVRDGRTTERLSIYLDDQTPFFGVWTITMEGLTTHRRVYGYLLLYPLTPETPQR